MPSSNSSFILSFSTRVVLLLLFLGSFQPSSTAAQPTRADNRWRDPCVGETPASMMLTTDKALDELSRSSTKLKKKVNYLKNDYVRSRFGDETHEEVERVYSGLIIPEGPSWTVSNDNMTETLLVCYENLARLAVFTRLTREAEQLAEAKENHHFANRFRAIEDHTEAGLYVILCKLYVLMHNLGIKAMSNETEAEVASISFKEVPNNAIRHIRDYIVLFVVENSADQLSSRFAQLVRVV